MREREQQLSGISEYCKEKSYGPTAVCLLDFLRDVENTFNIFVSHLLFPSLLNKFWSPIVLLTVPSFKSCRPISQMCQTPYSRCTPNVHLGLL